MKLVLSAAKNNIISCHIPIIFTHPDVHYIHFLHSTHLLLSYLFSQPKSSTKEERWRYFTIWNFDTFFTYFPCSLILPQRKNIKIHNFFHSFMRNLSFIYTTTTLPLPSSHSNPIEVQQQKSNLKIFKHNNNNTIFLHISYIKTFPLKMLWSNNNKIFHHPVCVWVFNTFTLLFFQTAIFRCSKIQIIPKKHIYTQICTLFSQSSYDYQRCFYHILSISIPCLRFTKIIITRADEGVWSVEFIYMLFLKFNMKLVISVYTYSDDNSILICYYYFFLTHPK